MGRRSLAITVLVVLCAASSGWADVFNMGPGLTSLETVPVGNPGNTGELSGSGAGGYGPDRVCGAVAYEYRIGKYEVTAEQYTEFLNKVAAADTYGVYNANMWSDTEHGCRIQQSGDSGSYSYSVALEWANRPVNYVSFLDACRFANWLHNGQRTGPQGPETTERGAYTLDGYDGSDGRTIRRNADWQWAVPSEDEWYKAAYHKNDGDTGNYFDYPTGIDFAPGQDMADILGNNANYYTGSGPYPIDDGKYTTLVGEFQNSPSPYGTFDQGGNVWEWHEASLDQDLDPGLRGGSFHGDASYLVASRRFAFCQAYEAYDISFGFRVVQVPEPASTALLALGYVLSLSKGGLAMIRQRRRRKG